LEDEQALPGVIAGNLMYTPTVFDESRILWIQNFYKQNNYIGLCLPRFVHKLQNGKF
jgi:hypothetical protein